MMALGIAYWAVFGLLFTFLGLPLHYLLPRQLGERLGRSLLHHAFRVFVNFLSMSGLVDADLRSLDRLKSLSGPLILAPNHTSLWDAVFLIARSPQPVCVMKATILCNPFLGGGAKLAGYIPGGHTTRMIRAAGSALSDRGQLLLFPEGTRTKPNVRWINPLKGGCALIAKRTNVPVYPVFIRSNTRFLQKGWPLWKRPEFPIRLSIELGEAMHLEEAETPAEFTCRLQRRFEHTLSQPHPLRRQV